MANRHYNLADRLLIRLQSGISSSHTETSSGSGRCSPAGKTAADSLSENEARKSAALMRVNHAGEVAAQALYAGQASTARNLKTRDTMLHAATEEQDHLLWCKQRVEELGEKTSLLEPLWYTGSWMIGAGAGLMGDRFSLGFVAETERQVVLHLDGHLQEFPENDSRSRAIVEQMKQDEQQHGQAAENAGAAPLPEAIKAVMSLTSKFMTRGAYWI